MQKNLDDIRQNLDEIAQIIAQTVPVESIYLYYHVTQMSLRLVMKI